MGTPDLHESQRLISILADMVHAALEWEIANPGAQMDQGPDGTVLPSGIPFGIVHSTSDHWPDMNLSE